MSEHSTTAPPESLDFRKELSSKEHHQHQQYTGTFTHPWFGPDEIPIQVTLQSPFVGAWSTGDQDEQITVQREGRNIVMTDEAGQTTLDGHEVLGGMLIGVVVQDGVSGGRFRLKPCEKLKNVPERTSIKWRVHVPEERRVQAPVISRWCAVSKAPVQVIGEGWRTTYQLVSQRGAL